MTPKGKRPRGVCPECKKERRIKADGTMGAHGRLNPSGHTIQRTCPGVDKEPEVVTNDT